MNSVQTMYAIVIIVAHGKLCDFGTPFDPGNQLYPTKPAECVAQYIANLGNQDSEQIDQIELDYIYVYSIADIGDKGYSKTRGITSRFDKTNVLFELFNDKYSEIKSRIDQDNPHDPTVMAYNANILEFFFKANIEEFKELYQRQAINSGDSRFLQQISNAQAFNIMPRRKSLNIQMTFAPYPSTIFKNVSDLSLYDHDEFSGVFLAFNTVHQFSKLFDITLVHNWQIINSLFGYDNDDDLHDTILRYIKLWNSRLNMDIRIIIKTDEIIEVDIDLGIVNVIKEPTKIIELSTINIYHIIFIILDYVQQITTLGGYSSSIMFLDKGGQEIDGTRNLDFDRTIKNFFKVMCNTAILKLYVDSFTCNDFPGWYSKEEKKAERKASKPRITETQENEAEQGFITTRKMSRRSQEVMKDTLLKIGAEPRAEPRAPNKRKIGTDEESEQEEYEQEESDDVAETGTRSKKKQTVDTFIRGTLRLKNANTTEAKGTNNKKYRNRRIKKTYKKPYKYKSPNILYGKDLLSSVSRRKFKRRPSRKFKRRPSRRPSRKTSRKL